MRKILGYSKWIFIVLIVMVILLYLGIMAMLQGPIVREVTDKIGFLTSVKEIELPWYLDFWLENDLIFEGVDEVENHYTWFSYSLPDIFEDAEVVIIVSWQDCRATLFAGESRAMDIIKTEYPMIMWND